MNCLGAKTCCGSLLNGSTLHNSAPVGPKMFHQRYQTWAFALPSATDFKVHRQLAARVDDKMELGAKPALDLL